jgi:hypothetical protein
MSFIERFVYGTVALVIGVVVLASVLPIVFPYIVVIFVLAMVGRVVWVRTGSRW